MKATDLWASLLGVSREQCSHQGSHNAFIMLFLSNISYPIPTQLQNYLCHPNQKRFEMRPSKQTWTPMAQRAAGRPGSRAQPSQPGGAAKESALSCNQRDKHKDNTTEASALLQVSHPPPTHPTSQAATQNPTSVVLLLQSDLKTRKRTAESEVESCLQQQRTVFKCQLSETCVRKTFRGEQRSAPPLYSFLKT